MLIDLSSVEIDLGWNGYRWEAAIIEPGWRPDPELARRGLYLLPSSKGWSTISFGESPWIAVSELIRLWLFDKRAAAEQETLYDAAKRAVPYRDQK